MFLWWSISELSTLYDTNLPYLYGQNKYKTSTQHTVSNTFNREDGMLR